MKPLSFFTCGPLAAAWIIPAVLVIVFSAGCGRKGPPVPPETSRLPAIADVRVEQENDRAVVSWTLRDSDWALRKNAAGFYVYRADAGRLPADGPDISDRFRQLAVVPIRGGEKRSERWRFGDYPPPESVVFYKIRSFGPSGVYGPESQTVSVVPAF